MGAPQTVPERQSFSSGAFLLFAVLVDLIAIIAAVLLLSIPLLSGLVMAAGAVITGALIKRVAGRRAMLVCFALAVLAFAAGLGLQLLVNAAH